MVVRTFTLGEHHHPPSPKLFLSRKTETLSPLKMNSPSAPPPAPATTIPLSVSMNHTVFVFLWPVYSTLSRPYEWAPPVLPLGIPAFVEGLDYLLKRENYLWEENPSGFIGTFSLMLISGWLPEIRFWWGWGWPWLGRREKRERHQWQRKKFFFCSKQCCWGDYKWICVVSFITWPCPKFLCLGHLTSCLVWLDSLGLYGWEEL